MEHDYQRNRDDPSAQRPFNVQHGSSFTTQQMENATAPVGEAYYGHSFPRFPEPPSTRAGLVNQSFRGSPTDIMPLTLPPIRRRSVGGSQPFSMDLPRVLSGPSLTVRVRFNFRLQCRVLKLRFVLRARSSCQIDNLKYRLH